MADYGFYGTIYLGNSIPAADFPRLAVRAEEQLDRYKRSYTVSGDAVQMDKAICAMADALYYFELAANEVTSCSVGSVSSGRTAVPDTSPKAQAAELYRCARQYLTIYRGVG